MADSNEDIAVKVTINVITEIFKACFSGLKDAEDWIKAKNKQYDPFQRAATKYVQQVEQRYNSMRIFGMNKPVPLRSIYTRINVLEKITARHRATIEELERYFDRDLRNFSHKQKSRDGISVVNQLNKFIVLGKPGAGKTTFLKYVALQALDGQLSEKRIPIFIGLKDWSDSRKSLMDFIIEQFDICGFPDAGPFIERLLSKGRCLILLDGLDEVTRNLDEVITQIRSFVDKYSSNQIILSCRIAAYNYCFEKFTDVEIADFTDQQIETFVNHWFGDGSAKATLCWDKIKTNRPIKELATIPLLLTLLCLAFDESMRFPTNKAELYKEAIDALLKKWDSSRSIKREESYHHLSLKRKEGLFSRIAASTFEKGQYFLQQRSLEWHIASYIRNLPEIKPETIQPDSEAILKSIEAQHGIFVERAKGIYSFSHLTFQEYFTARFIVDNAVNGILERFVKKYLIDDKWREIFLLVTGMLEDADIFFEMMLAQIKELGAYAFDTQLKKISSNIVKPRSPYSASASIALGIFYIMGRSPDATDYDKGLAFDLACALDPVVAQDIHVNRELVLNKAIYRYPQDAIRLFSSTQLNRIDDFIKAANLLLECLNSDCYVNRETRERLYETLLTPSE